MSAVTTAGASRVDPTTGSIPLALARLTWPIMTGSMTMVIHQLFNTLWLGRSSSEAVAAVAMAFPFLLFFYAIGDGIVFGSSALIARHTGAGEHDRVSQVAGHAALLVAVYYLLIAVLVLPFMDRILVLVGTPPDIIDDVLIFLRIQLIILPFSELFFVYSNMLQAMGNCVTPMKMWGATMAANMLLDPVLILGLGGIPAMGVRGAAIAAAVTRVAVAAITVRRMARGEHGLRILPEHLRPDPHILRRIVQISLPISGERLLMGAEHLVLVGIIARFGSPVLAAYGVGQRLLSLAFMPGFAAGTAVTALIGQNLGAGKVARAQRGTWISVGLVFAFLTSIGLILALAAPFIIPLFNAEPDVLELGIAYCRILGPAVGFAGLFFVLGGAYRAVERPLPFMVWSVVLSWALRIPLAVALPTVLGVNGIWYAMALAAALATTGAAGWLHYGYWCRADIPSISPLPTDS